MIQAEGQRVTIIGRGNVALLMYETLFHVLCIRNDAVLGLPLHDDLIFFVRPTSLL